MVSVSSINIFSISIPRSALGQETADQAAFDFATWEAIASINGGFRQS